MAEKTWKVGEKVNHPKRPEWGEGEVRQIDWQGRLHIHFAAAGPKVLDPSIATLLHGVEKGPVEAGEERRFALEPVKLEASALFEQAFSFQYPPPWVELFRETELPREWLVRHPFLFSPLDEEEVLRAQRRDPWLWRWLGAILWWHATGYRAVVNPIMPAAAEQKGQMEALLPRPLVRLLRDEHLVRSHAGLSTLACISPRGDDWFLAVARAPGQAALEEIKPFWEACAKAGGRKVRVVRFAPADKWEFWK